MYTHLLVRLYSCYKNNIAHVYKIVLYVFYEPLIIHTNDMETVVPFLPNLFYCIFNMSIVTADEIYIFNSTNKDNIGGI